ncbi:ligand-binding sensor domain-containing protein/signal transduction histidine kinase [Catalinimonas alkaloidigena]|uniref:sensor histidine kinase n=1 Tax=Catalinimonas alkaloidigena TaxID=1075417 RepID=UPI002404EA29|nr:sensor histidine kinase [Catalinimonas alkaloidigena]MDF9798031.1 ligand-binding sensor domain-containing protein/signal transduction histidine kinase [Catalinimonas alkaloidigena]
MINKKVILILIWIVSLSAYGQSNEQWEKNFRFDHFKPAIQDSLTSRKVNCFLRDKQGNSWFGTKQGLVYYNGHEVIPVVDSTNTGIPLNRIEVQVMIETSDEDIWIGTKNYGVLRFISKEKSYIQYTLVSPSNTNRQITSVLSLCEGENNAIWAGTFGGGIYYFDEQQQTFTSYQDQNDSSQMLGTSVVMDLHKDKNGMLWAATFGSGLFRIDPHYQTFKQYRATNKKGSLLTNDLFCLEEDAEGTLWIGTYGKGIYHYDRRTETFSEAFPELANEYIQDIFFNRGYIWMATQDKGVFCWNTQYPLLYNFSQSITNQFSISDNNVSQISIDEFGTLWVISAAGVDLAHSDNIYFSYLGSNPKSLINQPITAIATDRTNNIWMGTAGASMFQWIEEEKKLIKHDIGLNESEDISFSTSMISVISIDDREGVWIGTSEGKLLRWDNNKKKWKHYTLPLTFSTNESIESIYLDQKGTLWIGVLEHGLFYWNGQDDNIHSASELIPLENLVFTPKVFAENEEHLWIGTLSQGIFQWNRNTGQLTHYTKKDKGQMGLPSNQITGLSLDSQGKLYIGTFDQGVCRLDLQTKEFSQINEQSGLVSNRITSLSKTGFDKIWIATIEGVSSYNCSSGKIKNYSNQEFLNGKELVHYSETSTAEKVMLGTLNGIIQIESSTEEKPYKKPVIEITEFDSKEQQISFEPNKSVPQQVDLAYDDNAFEISYALQSFTFSEHHEYEYRLEGLDQQWKPVNHRTLASYTNLTPGTYRFYVRGRASQGEFIELMDPLVIVIHPAWYQTLLFKIIVFIAVIGVAGCAYYYRVTSVEKRNRMLETLVMERTSELTAKNKFIEKQHHNIQLQNQKLEEAKFTIQQKNDDLINLNEALEERVNQRTQELATTNEALVKTNKELDLFVYRAYHDIIGPIARIEGLGQIAAMEAGDNTGLDQYFDKLQDNCTKARTTLQKVLQIHHVRNHNIETKNINLLSLIQQIYDEVNTSYRDQVSSLSFEILCEPELYILTDQTLITLILKSFIKNALQYSSQKVDSWIRVIAEVTKLDELRISVEDNGVGIAPQVKDKVFTMFFRGHETKSSTGLGLYIAHLAAEKLAGGVAYTEDNGYTQFTFEVNYRSGSKKDLEKEKNLQNENTL